MVRFFAGTGPDTQALRVGPDSRLWHRAADSARTMALKGEIDTDNLSAGSVPPSFLIRAALMTCGMKAGEVADSEFEDASTFFFRKGLFDDPSCDSYLVAKQHLVCASDRLTELAEAVGPTVWTLPVGAGALDGVRGPFTFPPQDPDARHIVRDAALHTLAHVAWLDMARLPGDSGATCTDLYADAVRSPAQANTTDLFGAGVGGGTSRLLGTQLTINTNDDIAQLAATRLVLKAHLLRAAARMLPELVQDSVYADLAGGARKKAAQGDFQRGLKALWGNESDGYYCSKAHAARVLGQRWQYPASLLPPWQGLAPSICGTWDMAQGALEQVYGDDYTARTGSLPAVSNEQSEAIARLEGTGVVFDDDAIDANTPDQLRAAVVEQMLYAEASRAGMDLPDFRNTPAADTIESIFDGVSNADFMFAVRTIQDRYRTLTNRDKTAWDAADTATSNLSASLRNPANPAGMLVLASSLPKSELGRDILPAMAGIQTVAQCTQSVQGLRGTGADFGSDLATQSSFAMGQMFYSRLVVLRETAGAALASGGGDLPEDLDRVKTLADAAAAETRAWSGEGRIFAVGRAQVGSGEVERIELMTLGFEPEDFGAQNAAGMQLGNYLPAMGNRLALVYGRPHLAYCAAGLHSACPENVESYVVRPSSADVRSLWKSGTVPVPDESGALQERPIEEARRFYGVDGTWGRFVFDVPAYETEFRPAFVHGSTPNTRLYVVLTSDPASSDGAGKVLGSIALREPDQYSAVVVSQRERELYNAAFGVARSALHSLNVTGARSLAEAEAYCLPGVPYDVFVPLESEITSDGDGYESSWRSLLAQSRSSAERADRLGDAMLDWALQKELRREDANADLGEICGSYGLVDETTFSGGKVEPGETDGPLGECLDTETRDIVFLGEEPEGLAGLGPDDTTAFLKERVLVCNDVTGTRNRSGLCDKPVLTWGSLNLPNLGTFEAAPPVDCTEIKSLASGLPSGFHRGTLRKVSHAGWRDPEQLAALADSLRYVEKVRPNAQHKDWYVLWNQATTIMSSTGLPMVEENSPSTPRTIWPGCQRYGECPTESSSMQSAFTTIFKTAGISSAQMIAEDISWRVQGALWTIARMSASGSVPRRMFTVEVPVAHFTDPGGPTELLVPAIYGRGVLAKSGESYTLAEDSGVVPWDVADKLGVADEYPPGYVYPSSELMPSWLASFWQGVATTNADHVGYVKVEASSEEFSVRERTALGEDLDRLADDFHQQLCGGALFKTDHGGGEDSPAALTLFNEVKGFKHKTASSAVWSNICVRKHPDKRGTLQIEVSDDYEPSISFRDVLLAGKCNEDDWRYGTRGELLPTGAPNPALTKWWHVWDGNACATVGGGNVSVTYDCLNELEATPTSMWGTVLGECYGGLVYESDGAYAFGPWALRPDNCSKGSRVRMFINSYPARNACDAAAELIGALGLACQLQIAPPAANLAAPPDLDSLDDLSSLGTWLKTAGLRMAEQANRLYLENVPASVLKDFAAGTVGTGNNDGTVGQTRLEMGENLEAVRTHWRHIGETLALIGADVEGARISQQMAQNDLDQASLHLAIQRAESLARMGEAMARAVGHAFDGDIFVNPGSIAADATVATIENWRHEYVSDAVKQLEAKEEDQYDNSVAKILNDLDATMTVRLSSMEDDLSGFRTAVSDAKQQGSALRQLAARGRHAAAVAAGASFYQDQNGNVVQVPVNTVLNRQYDVTRRRYRNALTEARYLAFLTRVAIEQRLGERLDAVSFPDSTGPLESPGLWADDVCHMTGIDYDKYKDAPLPEWAKEEPASTPDGMTILPDLLNPQYRRNLLAYMTQQGVVGDLSKQYVGDYVSHLETFVTYYNTQFPSHDGDDTTVLSLRDDLLTRDVTCSEPGPNLLYFSDDLGRNTLDPNVGSTDSVLGWRISGCDFASDKCLRVIRPDGLDDVSDPFDDVFWEPPARGAEISWLLENEVPAGSVDQPVTTQEPPPRTMSQDLTLSPGSYVLSWWDRALTHPQGQLVDLVSDGFGLDLQLASTVTVLVTDESGKTLAGWQDRPEFGWSPRRSVGFEVSTTSRVSVNIEISSPGESRGSVAFVGMQLEKSLSADAYPSPYVANGATRTRLSEACPLSAQDVQASFDYKRDDSGRWFYELHAPVVVDTDRVDEAGYLNGKLAQGNFNYRHVNLALNLVGTGLVDCTGQPASCRDTNTVDYTLDHNARSIQLRGVGGLLRYFNFGQAYIHDGRALASEIEVETPVSAEYAGLLQQDGVTKTEYMGRPVDGVYRLRIWDRPGLQWHRLKDVQIVLKYRYWSAIRKDAGEPN